MGGEPFSATPGREPGKKDRAGRSDPPDQTEKAGKVEQPEGRGRRLRPSGGYRKLRSFQASTIIYDATAVFCERFVDKRSRTHDQMVQAARSGRQNIGEGSRAAATSSQTELRLVNVARSSLDELLLDYEDFLRQRGLRLWGKDSPQALRVRALAHAAQPMDRTDQSDRSDSSNVFGPYAPWLNHAKGEIVANTLICLIHQTNYLLDQQIGALERDFIQEGGYSEQLAAARIAERQRQSDQAAPSDRPNARLPACPVCGKLMALRTARQGKRAGSQFWGCTAYPACKGTRPVEGGDNRTDQTDRSDDRRC